MVSIYFIRFHPLSEFDDGKRSCRRRLAGHNRRRRKTQPEDATPQVSVPSGVHSDMNCDVDVINLLAALARPQGIKLSAKEGLTVATSTTTRM